MPDQEQDFQRWTAKRKAAVILEVLRNQVTGVDACRKYGIKQSELEDWTAQFLEGGENSLRSNPRDEQMLYEAKLKELHAKIGELTLERDVLRNKAWCRSSHARRSLDDPGGVTGRRASRFGKPTLWDLGSAPIYVLLRAEAPREAGHRLAVGGADLATDSRAAGVWDSESVGGTSISDGPGGDSEESDEDHAGSWGGR